MVVALALLFACLAFNDLKAQVATQNLRGRVYDQETQEPRTWSIIAILL